MKSSRYVKAVYNPETKKIEYTPVYSIKGDMIRKININRVGGYMNVYTNETDKDLYEEFFNKSTDFMDDFGWGMVGKPILINHGMDGAFKSMHVGVFDFENEDDVGRYVEGRLFDQKEYEEMLSNYSRRKGLNWTKEEIAKKSELAYKTVQAFFATGKVHWSSGALPQEVEVNPENGHIRRWPRIEGSGTMTPAEPDGTEVLVKQIIPNFEYSLKSAFEQLDAILNEHLSISPANQSPPTEAQPIEVNEDAVSIEGGGLNAQSFTTGSQIATHITFTSLKTIQGKNAMDFLQKLLAMIQEYMAAQGGEGAEAVASAEEVMDELKADTPEEELVKAMEDEEEAAKLAEKAYALVDARLAKKQKAFAGLEATRNARLEKLERASAARDPYGNGGSHKGAQLLGQSRIDSIIERSPFQNWKPEDYSFAIGLAQMSKNTGKAFNFRPDQRFYREFADKAEKAFREGSLKLDNHAIRGIYAIKSDELDYSTQAGYGDEWVPTVWADNIWERPRLDNVVQNLFQSVEMPSNPYEYPVESTDPTVYLVGETKHESVLALDISTSPIPDSKVATSKVTFTASKFGLRVMYSAELEEDGVSRLVPFFRGQSERAMQDAIDYVALNGDTSTTTNINSDGETITDTTRRYLAYDGLMHQPLVTATTNRVDASAAVPSLTLLRSARALLGNAEGYNPQNLAWIMDYPTYIKLLNDDVIITIDKYGSAATVVTGELGRIDGIPVFVSAQLALADSDGKITQTSNVVNRGRAILVHRPTWMFGYRRRINQSLDFLPWADAWSLVITMRNHFVPRTATNGTLQSTDDSTAIVYNLGV